MKPKNLTETEKAEVMYILEGISPIHYDLIRSYFTWVDLEFEKIRSETYARAEEAAYKFPRGEGG